MKKYRIFIPIIVCLIIIGSCNRRNNKEVSVELESSEIFTEKELQSAVNLVIENFSFPAAKLDKIVYIEKDSKKLSKIYLDQLDDNQIDKSLKNTLSLSSSFYVDSSGKNPVFEPDTYYDDYFWILSRKNESSKWEIKNYGF